MLSQQNGNIMYRILLIEDSKEIYQMVSQTTSSLAELAWAQTLKEAHSIINQSKNDLIILDLELPDGNGIDLCTKLQETHPHTPIFILTAHHDLSEKVLGFSAGADDYITKPFSILELRARLEARLRKTKLQEAHFDFYKWRELDICKSRQEVLIKKDSGLQKLDLTALEFKLLIYFAAHPGTVIGRDQILNDIWGEDIHVYHRSVDTHVSKLRRKLGAVAHIVESVHGSGYRFNPTEL
jgi:two-component system phosphate regulon response regulator PhoB